MTIQAYIPHGIAGISAVIALASFQQSSELSVADYAERIRTNELSIQSSTAELKSATSELQAISTRIEALARGANSDDLLQHLADIQDRLEALETQPTGTGGTGPTAEQVAAVLVRDHLALITGPAGPQGPQGAKGEQGQTGPQGAAGTGNGGDPSRPIEIDANFTSDYPSQFWQWGEVQLLGCTSRGKVTCSFLVTPTQDKRFDTRSEYQRIALTDGTWVKGSTISMNGVRDKSRSQHVLSVGIPTRFEVDFPTQDQGEGLLALELHESGEKISWRNVAYSR